MEYNSFTGLFIKKKKNDASKLCGPFSSQERSRVFPHSENNGSSSKEGRKEI